MKIESIELKDGFESLPKGFLWENIKTFSIITGLNGVGKTHLLKAIYQYFNQTPMKRDKIFNINFSSDSNFSALDIQYVKYDETLLSQIINLDSLQTNFHVSDNKEEYKTCIVLLFLKEKQYYGMKDFIRSTFPNITEDKADRINGVTIFHIKDHLAAHIECIFSVLKEDEEETIKRKIEDSKREFEHVVYSKKYASLCKASHEKNTTQKKFIDEIYECIEKYLPAITGFKPWMDKDDKISMQFFLDSWFRSYVKKKK